jgi:tetratricopeptide (TPR) repeat protein
MNEPTSPASETFLSVLKVLKSDGLNSAQRLSQILDAAQPDACLEEDLILSTETNVKTCCERLIETSKTNRANRLLRCALFSLATGRDHAAFDFLAGTVQTLALEVVMQWAILFETQLGDHAAALAIMRVSAIAHSKDARAQWQIACALAEWPDDAARNLRRETMLNAWLLNPQIAPALPLQLALEMRHTGDWNAVERICSVQLAHNPGDIELAWQLANAQWRRHDPAAAEATMRRVHAISPASVNAATAIALFVAEQARYGAARERYESALELDPSAPTAAVDLAELELREGDWSRGFARYEARLARADRTHNNVVSIFARVAPHWTGQPLEGRTLLVYSEQGHGDDIQMLRFIPNLAARVRNEGGRLVLACRRALYPLFARHYTSCVEIESLDFAQQGIADYCLPMMSLPFVLGLKAEDVRGTAYLKPDAARSLEWESRLRATATPRDALQIGLAWRGSPTHRRDEQRSIPLEALATIFAVENVVFHPLTPGSEALPASAPHCDLTGSYQCGFEDVAAHVCALDAVVTIDSAPLHLGGALGVPVYAMLDHVSHWAWGYAEAQPWYDSVTLFRQPRPGDWQPVVARVADHLERLAMARMRQPRSHEQGRQAH